MCGTAIGCAQTLVAKSDVGSTGGAIRSICRTITVGFALTAKTVSSTCGTNLVQGVVGTVARCGVSTLSGSVTNGVTIGVLETIGVTSTFEASVRVSTITERF